MNYQTLSPSDCAAEVLEEILKCVGDNPVLKDKVARLVRQKARAIYEHCAMIAEDYVAFHDRDETMSGLQVGDAIAETIRCASEERKGSRLLSDLRIAE